MTSPASVPASAPTPSPFRLGFLAFVEHGGVSGATSQGLQDGIDLFRHADELGFDTGWVRHRHLLVAHLIRSPIVVGSPTDIADHLETWFRASAVDGFNVLNAFLHEQFETFARLVVPELRSRGLVRDEYEAGTLRGHLGSPLPGTPVPPLAAAHLTRTD